MFTSTTIAIGAFIIGIVLGNSANDDRNKLNDAEKEIADLRDKLGSAHAELVQQQQEYESMKKYAFEQRDLADLYEDKYGELEPKTEE